MSESNEEICRRERLLRLDAHIRFELQINISADDLSSYRRILNLSTFILA